MLIVTLFAIELFGFLGNPYIGIIAFLILPGVFLVGLLLIPWGIARERKLARKALERGQPPPRFPVIDLNFDQTRKWVLLFVVMTAANVVILAVATYKGVEVMESTEFCGTTCHVMAPEYTAYERSPHSRVKCVACHIGPGADWFVKSKLSGAWQVISVAFELYPTPIPTPVHDLRPARETCEQCHWPTKFVGDRLRVITHHADDEANSELKTVLLMHIGGLDGATSKGIHWHVDPDHQIRYRSNESREKIYEVELTGADGTVKRYFAGGDADSEEEGAPAEWRIMDCVDCHNRPTHVFRSPAEEVDLALQQGRIPRSLPYVRREGILALNTEYATHEAARQGIASAVNSFYEKSYPDLPRESGSAVQKAGETLGEIYCTNVFPSMKVSWGTYPSHLGHESSGGCFRCHNDDHATAEGEVISQDCFSCHALLAMEEEAPEILETLDQ